MIKASKSLDYISLNELQEYNDVCCRCIDFSVLFVVFCEHNYYNRLLGYIYLFIFMYMYFTALFMKMLIL